ncbi:22144_t:CDS:2, partial [Rhizophagus irregularis]
MFNYHSQLFDRRQFMLKEKDFFYVSNEEIGNAIERSLKFEGLEEAWIISQKKKSFNNNSLEKIKLIFEPPSNNVSLNEEKDKGEGTSQVVDTTNKYIVRRNTENSTDVKDYTTLKVLKRNEWNLLKKKEARRRTYQEWNDE